MDDAVEMEFISVMGVLVPTEMARGVSDEAKRFAAGDLSDEEEMKADDPVHFHEEEETIDILEQENSLSSNGKAKNKDSYDKFLLSEKKGHAECVSEEREIVGSALELEKRKQRVKMKKHKRKQRQKEKMEHEQKEQEKKQSRMVKAQENKFAAAKIDQESLRDEHERKRKKSDIAKTSQTRALKKKLAKPTSKEVKTGDTEKFDDARTSKSKKKLASAASVDVPARPKGNRPVKRSIRFEQNSTLTKHKMKKASAQDKISETWRLESDEEASKLAEGSKSSSPALATRTMAKESTKGLTDIDQDVCAYPSCTQPAKYKCRCAEHNGRLRCSLSDCTKFAHSGGKCIGHGGGARCTEEGCERRVRSNGKCYAHGGGILCSHPKCTTRAKSKGKCIAHGGGTVCAEIRCSKLVTANGKCIAHGGWLNCSHRGCNKRVQVRGKCIEHSEAAASNATDKPAKRFRSARSKTAGVDVSTERASKRPKSTSTKSTTVEIAKASKKSAMCSEIKGELEQQGETAMALRSGHRITKIARGYSARQDGLHSEEAALQMALKLSKIEY